MQTYRFAKRTPWELFSLILHQALHIYYSSIITAKERTLTEKIIDDLHLKRCANQLSISCFFKPLFSRLRRLEIFSLCFYTSATPKTSFPAPRQYFLYQNWVLDQSQVYEFVLWPNLRPIAVDLETKTTFRSVH